MKFNILAMLGMLTSAQELFLPVTDVADADCSCAFVFTKCDKSKADTSAFWKIDTSNSSCDKDPITKNTNVKVVIHGTGISSFTTVSTHTFIYHEEHTYDSHK